MLSRNVHGLIKSQIYDFLIILLIIYVLPQANASTKTKDNITKFEKDGNPTIQSTTGKGFSNCSQDHILSETVCLLGDYLRADLPFNKGSADLLSLNTMTVNAESEIVTIRDVDDQMQTITFEIFVHLQWRDDRIKVRPLPGKEMDVIGSWSILDGNQIHRIWNPDITIYNMTNFKRLSILNPTNGILKIHANKYLDEILVDYTFNAEVTISCAFDYTRYPKDEQSCELRMGSTSYGRHLKFVLWSVDPGVAYKRSLSDPLPQKFNIKGFRMSVQAFTDNFTYCTGEVAKLKICKARHLQHVVFDIHMKRFFQPFFMHYYAPCIAIVFVTQASFIIPPDCIPGRVALLVTQFLTLVNIFIDQQVGFKRNNILMTNNII